MGKMIRTDYKVMTELDFIFARGSLALSMNASRPVFNNERRILIREGRHPLIDRKKVVPITISLGDTFDLLIVTGPNTATITKAQVQEIAELKMPDLNAASVESAMSMIAGTCRSMGVTVTE